jgi:hypothetical protein
VVELRLVDLHQDALRRRVGPVRVGRGDAELRDVAGVVEARRPAGPQRRAVVDEEPAVAGVLRMEREPQQPALVEPRHQRHHPTAQVEERRREQRAVGGQHPDQAGLVGHEQPARPVARRYERDRRRQSLGDRLDPDRG